MHDHALPHVGLRMVKSAAAVLICLLVSMLVNREEMRILQKQLAEPNSPPENVKVPVKCVSHQPRQE